MTETTESELPSQRDRWFLGRTKRTTFVLSGIAFMLVKAVVDSAVAGVFFGREWSTFNYLSQEQVSLALTATDEDRLFYAAMLTLALPFIGAGILLIVRRLRDAGAPLWPAFLFFIPTLNLLFFVILSVLPSRGSARASRLNHEEGGIFPVMLRDPAASALIAILVSTLLGTLLSLFNIHALRVYGLGLFVGLPFCIGTIAAVIHGHAGGASRSACVLVALTSVLGVGAALLVIAAEGAACLIMAAPVWLGCAALGGCVGNVILQCARDEREKAVLVISLALSIPALMGAEYGMKRFAPLYEVRSMVEVQASPVSVWRKVVSFPDLPPPTEWLFQTGVAYPVRATLDGYGVGSERRCEFLTGVFVEPIVVWDEPHQLKFAVTANPPPMREWSLYQGIHPPHLEGFLISEAGQFRLTQGADGGTRLEGTTWYRHHMWPASYWRLYSDYIIHRIHLRVLNHIRTECESSTMNATVGIEGESQVDRRLTHDHL